MQKDKKLDTKEKILRGAADPFSERGYFGVSMNEVALNVGISKATRDLLTGTNIFRKFTHKVLQVVIVNILSFTLNPFMEIKKDNEITARRFAKLISV